MENETNWWNKLTVIERNRLIFAIQDAELDNNSLTQLINDSLTRFPPRMIKYYRGVLERMRNVGPMVNNCDAVKIKRFPKYEDGKLRYDLKSIMVLLAHCYPSQRTKAEKHIHELDINI